MDDYVLYRRSEMLSLYVDTNSSRGEDLARGNVATLR